MKGYSVSIRNRAVVLLLLAAAIPVCADETSDYAEQERKRIEARMALRVQDPVKEYYENWCCGPDVQRAKGEKELLQIVHDLNADGRKDMLLSMNFLDNGRAGTIWEIYLAGDDGYRWIDSLLILEDRTLMAGVCKPLGRNILVGYWINDANQGALQLIYVENDKVVSVELDESDSGKGIRPDMDGLKGTNEIVAEDINKIVIPFAELEERYGKRAKPQSDEAFFAWLQEATATPEALIKTYDTLMTVGFESGGQVIAESRDTRVFQLGFGDSPPEQTRGAWSLMAVADALRLLYPDARLLPLAVNFRSRMLDVLERKTVPTTFERRYAMLFLTRVYLPQRLVVKSTRPLREVEILAMRYAHDTDVGVRRAAVFALVGVVYNDHSRCQAVEAVVRELAAQAKKEVENDEAAPAVDLPSRRLQQERQYWHRFLERTEIILSHALEREKDMVGEAAFVAVDRMSDADLLTTVGNSNATLAQKAVDRLTDTWVRTTQHFDELLKLAYTSPAGYGILLKIGLPVPESASPQEKENWDLLAASVNTLPEKALRFGEGSGGDPWVTFLLHLGDEETLRRIREKTDADTSEVRPYGLDVVREGVVKFLRDPNAWPPQLRDVVWRLTGRGNHESILVRMKPDIEELRARVDAGKIAFKFDEHKQKLIDAIDDALSRIAELEAAGQMDQNRTE